MFWDPDLKSNPVTPRQMSHNCICRKRLNVEICGEAAAHGKNCIIWANLGIFCYFFAGGCGKM